MEVRFYLDPETGLPHILDHGVTEEEAKWICSHPVEDEAGSSGTRQAIGQSEHGRYLRVIDVPDDDNIGVFVITAYSLTGKQLKAFRRRKRRRGR